LPTSRKTLLVSPSNPLQISKILLSIISKTHHLPTFITISKSQPKNSPPKTPNNTSIKPFNPSILPSPKAEANSNNNKMEITFETYTKSTSENKINNLPKGSMPTLKESSEPLNLDKF
jgi:hypothetical protein